MGSGGAGGVFVMRGAADVAGWLTGVAMGPVAAGSGVTVRSAN